MLSQTMAKLNAGEVMEYAGQIGNGEDGVY